MLFHMGGSFKNITENLAGFRCYLTHGILLMIGVLWLSGCQDSTLSCLCEEPSVLDEPTWELDLRPVHFADLPQWDQDKTAEVLEAFAHSCTRILRQPPHNRFGMFAGTYADWHPACETLQALRNTDDPNHNTTNAQARNFFETHFRPFAVWGIVPDSVAHAPYDTGLFTGYYEPRLRGSFERSDVYHTPLRRKPDDLVMVDLGQFRESLRGQRIAGRVREGRLFPYEERADIMRGAIDAPDGSSVLVWVDDAIDAFFLHIQGSGIIDLPDGSVLRVGYAGQNGHVYYAIGRALVARGVMESSEVSLQSIAAWMRANPSEATDLMNLNPSYVFFTPLTTQAPLGGENVPLTPKRSLAIDRSLAPYGLPVWVDIEPPVPDSPVIRRLMIAQDTGGAIRGPVRGDFFWGSGDKAAYLAGHMKSQGRYWFLLPAHLEPQQR